VASLLGPNHSFASNWLWIAGGAKLYLRQSAEAVVRLQQSIELNRNTPITHFLLACALAHLGRLNEAQLAIQAGLGIAPHFNMRRWSAAPYSDHPSYMERRAWVAEGLRKARLSPQLGRAQALAVRSGKDREPRCLNQEARRMSARRAGGWRRQCSR